MHALKTIQVSAKARHQPHHAGENTTLVGYQHMVIDSLTGGRDSLNLGMGLYNHHRGILYSCVRASCVSHTLSPENLAGREATPWWMVPTNLRMLEPVYLFLECTEAGKVVADGKEWHLASLRLPVLSVCFKTL